MQIQRSLTPHSSRPSILTRARFTRLMILGSTLLLAAILAAFVLYPAGHISSPTTNYLHTTGQQIAGSGPGDSPPSTPTPTPTP